MKTSENCFFSSNVDTRASIPHVRQQLRIRTTTQALEKEQPASLRSCLQSLKISMPATFAKICLAGITLLYSVVSADETRQSVKMIYIKQTAEALPKLSNLELPPEDDGVLGGRQAIEDNNNTGKFLGHHYALENAILDMEADVHDSFRQAFDRGIRHFILDLSADNLLKLADSKHGQQAWFYNIGAANDRLRTEECRRNVLHLVASDSQRADALAQYLVAKKWRNWFLVSGRRASDINFATAVRRAAKKFGGKIVADKSWEYGPDMRRTAASTVPLFTQGVDYDVLIVADVVGEFGEYLMYRTWTPRPVVGTQGLTPVAWHKSHEQWGAAQLQSRFLKTFGRKLSEKDYNLWSSVRVIGEAVTRTDSTDDDVIASYIRSERFGLAAYKGQKLSFRQWNLQLRQPILLVSPTSLVAVSPQRQFLHERTPLDTMGYDRQESSCKLDQLK